MVSHMIMKTLNNLTLPGLIMQNVESVTAEPHRPLVRKQGYVSKTLSNALVVVIDGDDDETIHFMLEGVEVTFAPRKFDQIVLLCEIDEESNQIVKRIEGFKIETIQGKVTSIQQGIQGIIESKYLFYWEQLDVGLDDIMINDEVEASCVKCKITDDNKCARRCLKVTRIYQPTANLPTTIQYKDTMNKHGIEICENVAVELNDINETKDFQMMVTNTSCDAIEVLESRIMGCLNISQLALVSPTRMSKFVLMPGNMKEYKFKATAKRFSTDHERFTITFTGVRTGEFNITRYIKVTVHDTKRLHRTIGTGSNVLKNTGYTRSVLAERNNSSWISGPQPRSTPNFEFLKFAEWPLPDILCDIALNPGASRTATFDALVTMRPHLKEILSAENYSRVFHDLLHLEECAMEHNIRIYDVHSYFKSEGQYLALEVQNVAESRPSIVIGDYVKAVKPSSSKDDKRIGFRGTIHEVKQNRILLKFHECFREKYNGEVYQLTFHFSRRSLKKQHHAIELAIDRLQMSLFPDEIDELRKQVDVQLNEQTGELQSDNIIIPWFNPDLNQVQKEAIVNILQGVARPLPYVIFGPPGTGKTVTVIETILQIVKNIPRSRILVATPSNSAANLITERIIQSEVLKQNQFMRLISHNSVIRGSISPTILKHCGTIHTAREDTDCVDYKVSESGLQRNCNITHLTRHRILIGTCITLGTLMQLNFPKNHFTHVVIDESGQSMETESIIPMSFVDNKIGQIILAGDPKQLGPIVMSPQAKNLGLGRSFLDRLLRRDLYKVDTGLEARYDPRILTRLVYNYRSVPSILSVYSDLFYEASLKPMINDVDSEDAKLLKSLARILPNNKANGVVFKGVNGKNDKCSESPSWYNNEEADAISKFFEHLIRMGQKPSDIGIITPHTQQVKIIRRELIRYDSSDLKIGTVEEFQGQERKIILLSTVRTVERHLSTDHRYFLGFINHPNRMNVAISRARALLVVFGSPEVLSLDDHWAELIKHCKRNDSFVDCKSGNSDV